MATTEEDKKEITPKKMLEEYEDLNKATYKEPIFDDSRFDFSAEIVEKALYEDELGDRDLFISIYAKKFLFDKAEKRWYYWNEDYWRIDKVDESKNQIRHLRKVFQYYIEKMEWEILKLQKLNKSNDIEKIRKKIEFAKNRINFLGKDARLKTILKMCQDGVDSLAYPGEGWDRKEKVLLLKNGSVDLTTGKLKKGDPDDFLRTPCPVKLTDRKKQPKEWLKLFFSTYGGDMDLIHYIHKLIGYSTLGVNEQQLFIIFYGWYGRNGKSVIFDTLKLVLGEIMYKLPDDFLIKKRQESSHGAPNAVLRGLESKRLVWCSEVSAGDKMDTAKIKSITGDEPISARGNWEKEQKNFRATFLPCMLCNRLPFVEATDEPFWDRTIVLPHKLTFKRNPTKPHERKIDFRIKHRLLKELPEIMNWIIDGALLYQQEGLDDIPESVIEATREYKDNEDKIGFFINEYYDITKTEQIAERGDMFKLYKKWCDESGYKPLVKIKFFNEVGLRFKTGNDRNTHYFEGLGMLNNGTVALMDINTSRKGGYY